MAPQAKKQRPLLPPGEPRTKKKTVEGGALQTAGTIAGILAGLVAVSGFLLSRQDKQHEDDEKRAAAQRIEDEKQATARRTEDEKRAATAARTHRIALGVAVDPTVGGAVLSAAYRQVTINPTPPPQASGIVTVKIDGSSCLPYAELQVEPNDVLLMLTRCAIPAGSTGVLTWTGD
jgi:nitrogen fixation-related uncharacterized protein